MACVEDEGSMVAGRVATCMDFKVSMDHEEQTPR